MDGLWCAHVQITSTSKIKVTRNGDEVTVTGIVENTWKDHYNWNPGMQAFVPGYGYVSDEDGTYLQEHGGAKPFELQSTWRSVITGKIVLNTFWFNSSEFKWK